MSAINLVVCAPVRVLFPFSGLARGPGEMGKPKRESP
jgi:hypothetical protein